MLRYIADLELVGLGLLRWVAPADQEAEDLAVMGERIVFRSQVGVNK